MTDADLQQAIVNQLVAGESTGNEAIKRAFETALEAKLPGGVEFEVGEPRKDPEEPGTLIVPVAMPEHGVEIEGRVRLG